MKNVRTTQCSVYQGKSGGIYIHLDIFKTTMLLTPEMIKKLNISVNLDLLQDFNRDAYNAFYTPKPDTTTKPETTFLWKDKTGRGFSSQISAQAIQEHGKGERSYDGVKLRKWANEAAIGDTWENSTDHYTRIS